MEEDEDASAPSNASAASSSSASVMVAATRRHRMWILAVLLVAGSCMLAVVHLASGLHSQLLAHRIMVQVLKDELMAEAEERERLLLDKDASMTKTSTLRTKSKQVTEELLDQQKKARKLQHELVLAREDVQILTKNCSLANQRLRNRYEVTLRTLHDRVVTGEECRALLERNVDDRAKLEASLSVMQDRTYNVSKMLKMTKQKLQDALRIAIAQRDEIIRLKREVEQAKKLAASSSSAQSSLSQSSSGNDESENGDTQNHKEVNSEQASSSSSTVWKKFFAKDKEKDTMRPYWYNTETKQSTWNDPFAPKLDKAES